MDKLSVIGKIGTILSDLSEQQKYFAENPESLNEVEVELFAASASYLSEYAKVLRKFPVHNERKTVAPGPEPDDSGATLAGAFLNPEPAPHTPQESTAHAAEQPAPEEPAAEESAAEEPAPEEPAAPRPDAPFTPAPEQPVEPPHPTPFTPAPEQPDEPAPEQPVREKPEEPSPDRPLDPSWEKPASPVWEKPSTPTWERPIPPSPEKSHESAAGIAGEARNPFPGQEQEAAQSASQPEEARKLSLNERFNVKKQALYERFSPKQTEQPVGSPISNLGRSIGINERYYFIKTLFHDDKVAFDQAITRIDMCHSLGEALEYTNRSLSSKYNWSRKEEDARKFYDLLKRRFV